MSLSADAKPRAKIYSFISRHDLKLCMVCYVAGVVWFLLLAYPELNARTYMSENALLPGLVESDFDHDHGATDYYRELKAEINKQKEADSGSFKYAFRVVKSLLSEQKEFERQTELKRYKVMETCWKRKHVSRVFRDGSGMVPYFAYEVLALCIHWTHGFEGQFEEQTLPTDWLVQAMNNIGLDTYVQNYSFKYPHYVHKEKIFHGQNVYGILRAVRTAGTEAVVLSAPFRPEPFTENTLPGIALMLGIAKNFRNHVYWAKDVVFLITDDDEIGMQAWLSAYHHTHNDYIMAGELTGRSGAIQAAVNLEISTDVVSRLDLRIEGLNGQLPNLDLVNTAVKLCKREGLTPTLHKRADRTPLASMDGYMHSLKTMLLQMSHLATGWPTGNHGLFHRYNIEAITLHSVKLKSGRTYFNFAEVGRVVQGIFRSLNNLLERFHQSFFFYLLPSVERYVSIGVYMPPFGIMALPVVFKVISLWLSCRQSLNEEVATDDKVHGSESSTQSEKVPDKSKESTVSDSSNSTATSASINKEKNAGDSLEQLISYVACVMTSVFFGCCAFYGVHAFVSLAYKSYLDVYTAVTIGWLSVHFAIILSPYVIQRKILTSKRYDKVIQKQKVDARAIQCMSLLVFGILLGTTAIVNVSLAFFIAVLAVPVVITTSPTHSRLLGGIKRLLLLLISPLSAIFIACVIGILLNHKANSWPTVVDVTVEAWSRVEHGLLTSAVQMDMFNNWTYGIITLAFLSNWAMFWQLLTYEPYSNS